MAQELLLPALRHPPPLTITFCLPVHSRMCWALSRCHLFCMDLQQGSCGGRDRLCLELEELIQGCSAVPPPLGDNHPNETQLLVIISKNTPSTAALCKKERPQDNKTYSTSTT